MRALHALQFNSLAQFAPWSPQICMHHILFTVAEGGGRMVAMIGGPATVCQFGQFSTDQVGALPSTSGASRHQRSPSHPLRSLSLHPLSYHSTIIPHLLFSQQSSASLTAAAANCTGGIAIGLCPNAGKAVWVV